MLSLPMFCSNCKYFCEARNYVTVFHAHVLVETMEIMVEHLSGETILLHNEQMPIVSSSIFAVYELTYVLL